MATHRDKMRRGSITRRDPAPKLPPPEDVLAYTPQEAADQLRISRAAIYRLFKKQAIVPSQIGGLLRVAHEELVRYLRATRVA